MKLILTNRYPFPFPPDLTAEEQETVSNNATDHDLTLDGVIHFQWLHTLTVEFKDEGHLAEAVERTGWKPWGDDKDRFILEAATSRLDGYDSHPAVIVRNEAWCGAMIVADKTTTTTTTYD